MNGYVMEYQGKRYATNADNLMEAEENLFEHLGTVDYSVRLKTARVDSLENLKGKDEIHFF